VTIGALLPAYRELLALHVISVIVWMAGMIMLPVVLPLKLRLVFRELNNDRLTPVGSWSRRY
jgi:uncharacterized membrane protein